jgi:hypothetical protein
MNYSRPQWEFAADSHLLKLQRLQSKVLRTIGDVPRRTPAPDLHVAFKIPYMYDFARKLCRQQTEVTRNHENVHVRNIGQSEAEHRKYGGSLAYDR